MGRTDKLSPMPHGRWRAHEHFARADEATAMLVLSRRADESIVIQPAEGANSAMTLAELFANGPIQITLLGGTGRRVKMGIEAPEQLSIRRKDVD
jgi:sRNA-binding carbon storage regulator CsrA